MILLRYDSTRAYKLYDPNKRKVVVSKDILVDESKGWDWKMEITTSSSKSVAIEL